MLGRSIHLTLIPLFVPVAPLDSNGAAEERWIQKKKVHAKHP